MSEPVKRCLVAYGNPLRGDDGAAWELAAALGQEDWTVLTRIQLLPELSEDLRNFDVVVFADACTATGQPLCTRLVPQSVEGWPVHCGRPEQLLFLCDQLYGQLPQAWMLSLPGESFDYQLGLSRRAQRSVASALGYLRNWPEHSAASG